MLLRVLRHIAEKALNFSRDGRGSVTVDFVISIPILVGVLVITSEYGRVLQMRTTLDNAVSDATRYLTRVQPDEATGQFTVTSRAFADELIRNRLNSDFIDIDIPMAPLDVGGVQVVEVAARVGVETRALSILNLVTPADATLDDGTKVREIEGIVISAAERFPHQGR
ncbi:MAG: TadE/TadG family type IV pilus assembly protein [Pseudomonadota bacterium]